MEREGRGEKGEKGREVRPYTPLVANSWLRHWTQLTVWVSMASACSKCVQAEFAWPCSGLVKCHERYMHEQSTITEQYSGDESMHETNRKSHSHIDGAPVTLTGSCRMMKLPPDL